jgi:flagellar motor protein MotB
MSKLKKHEEHENHERWLVSYADFITLLFAFFVVLYATSNSDLEKQKKFEGSIKESMKMGAPDIKMLGIATGQGQGKSANSPIPNLPGDNLNIQTELDEYVQSFFKAQEPRIQGLRARIKITSEPEGVTISINESQWNAELIKNDLIVLGALFRSADSNIKIESRVADPDADKKVEKLLAIRSSLIATTKLSDNRFSIVLTSQSPKSIDSQTIRFTIIR